MSESPKHELMPRREFIRKSVKVSGAAFVGMAVGGKVPLPELTERLMPSQASSGSTGPGRRPRPGRRHDDDDDDN